MNIGCPFKSFSYISVHLEPTLQCFSFCLCVYVHQRKVVADIVECEFLYILLSVFFPLRCAPSLRHSAVLTDFPSLDIKSSNPHDFGNGRRS